MSTARIRIDPDRCRSQKARFIECPLWPWDELRWNQRRWPKLEDCTPTWLDKCHIPVTRLPINSNLVWVMNPNRIVMFEELKQWRHNFSSAFSHAQSYSLSPLRKKFVADTCGRAPL